jgi:hypothetical protein
MKFKLLAVLAMLAGSVSALAVTYRTDIAPLWQDKCSACDGAQSPERAANLKLFKDWVGEGDWNLSRWYKKGDVPAVSKGQLETVKVAY